MAENESEEVIVVSDEKEKTPQRDLSLAQALYRNSNIAVSAINGLPYIENEVIDEFTFISVLTSNATRNLQQQQQLDSSNLLSFSFEEETQAEKENCAPVAPAELLLDVDEDLGIFSSQVESFLPDTLIDESIFEQKAMRKMHEKIVIARNQFHWDMVSVQAANKAILKYRQAKL